MSRALLDRNGEQETRPCDGAARAYAVASTAQVYPELVNGQAVVGVAERLVAELRERLSVMPLEEAVA